MKRQAYSDEKYRPLGVSDVENIEGAPLGVGVGAFHLDLLVTLARIEILGDGYESDPAREALRRRVVRLLERGENLHPRVALWGMP